jgi:hypothetical protein
VPESHVEMALRMSTSLNNKSWGLYKLTQMETSLPAEIGKLGRVGENEGHWLFLILVAKMLCSSLRIFLISKGRYLPSPFEEEGSLFMGFEILLYV